MNEERFPFSLSRGFGVGSRLYSCITQSFRSSRHRLKLSMAKNENSLSFNNSRRKTEIINNNAFRAFRGPPRHAETKTKTTSGQKRNGFVWHTTTSRKFRWLVGHFKRLAKHETGEAGFSRLKDDIKDAFCD